MSDLIILRIPRLSYTRNNFLEAATLRASGFTLSCSVSCPASVWSFGVSLGLAFASAPYVQQGFTWLQFYHTRNRVVRFLFSRRCRLACHPLLGLRDDKKVASLTFYLVFDRLKKCKLVLQELNLWIKICRPSWWNSWRCAVFLPQLVPNCGNTSSLLT